MPGRLVQIAVGEARLSRLKRRIGAGLEVRRLPYPGIGRRHRDRRWARERLRLH